MTASISNDNEPFQHLLETTWAEVERLFPHWKKIPRVLKPHGDMQKWEMALADLPGVNPSEISLASVITIGTAKDISVAASTRLKSTLKALHPWRKGPFDFFGIHVDSEWRSDMKWQRLEGAITPLLGRRVLDVGCGNGYYGWRMLEAGARQVIGIDPTRVFLMQFLSAQHYLQHPSHQLLPLALEDLPQGEQEFDTVFSMGVLSHRRDPIEHLKNLRHRLVPNGELVLETLVVQGKNHIQFEPRARYARMRNIWVLPTPELVVEWLQQSGFSTARVLDVTATTPLEQRTTDWMWFESLTDSLDPERTGYTIEGHPAPRRAIFIARA